MVLTLRRSFLSSRLAAFGCRNLSPKLFLQQKSKDKVEWNGQVDFTAAFSENKHQHIHRR